MRILSDPARLPAAAPVYLYGAGQGGRIVKAALTAAEGPAVAGFVDRAPGGDIDGLPVIAAATFLDSGDRNATVVIASQHWKEIAASLKAAGFRSVHSAHPIIERHLNGAAVLERRRRRLKAAGLGASLVVLILLTWLIGAAAA